MLNSINAECRYVECCYTECRYAECRGAPSKVLIGFKPNLT
jgi:hypothetical protein